MQYIRETGLSFKPPFLGESEYKAARASLPFVCTDAVIADAGNQTICLAWRQATPAQGWWVIGGGVKNGQPPVEAMTKNFLRETSLDLPQDRFKLLTSAINFTQWTIDEQISNVHFPFKVELTDEESTQVNAKLDQQEYEQAKGLRSFTLDQLRQLIEDGVGYPHPILYYDAIFGTQAYPEALKRWHDLRGSV